MQRSARKQQEQQPEQRLSEQRNNLTEEQKSCQCETCSKACSWKPGWFLPGEAEKAAKFMKMSFKEFFKKYLAIDWWNGKKVGEETFVIAPALTGQPTGEEYPANPTGACIFFVNKKCSIHGAKPFECQMFWHGETPTSHGKDRHKQVADAWRDHQNEVEQILGRKPAAPEPTIGDMLSMLSGMFG
jgi:Fe-S-cluster containining protein